MAPKSLFENASRESILVGIRQILLDGKARTANQICLELSKQGIVADIDLVRNLLQADGRTTCTYDRNGLTYVALPQYRINPMVTSIIQRLLIQSKGQWSPLPDWVRFYIELGAILSSWNNGEKRYVLAISVPSRRYVAALLAMGLLLTSAWEKHQKVDLDQHFETLRGLKLGTPVTLRLKNKRFKGMFAGCVNDKIQITVQKQGNLTHWISREHADQVEVVSSTRTFNLPGSQSGRILEPPSPFLTNCLGKRTDNFIHRTHLDCVILGYATWLSTEITEMPIDLETSSRKPIPGTIGDIVRVRRFIGDTGYNAEVIPIDREYDGNILQNASPRSVIFDGAIGYLKWRYQWQQFNSITILDRTERQFSDAAQTFNQEFLTSKRSEPESSNVIPPLPAGVEIMLYEELCK